MEFFRIKKDIPFMRHALIFNLISVATFIAAIAFIAIRGLHFSIEFTGGTVMEVSYPQAAPLAQVFDNLPHLGKGCRLGIGDLHHRAAGKFN